MPSADKVLKTFLKLGIGRIHGKIKNIFGQLSAQQAAIHLEKKHILRGSY